MAGKGQPKSGGRKKGVPNKLTQSVQEFIEAVLTQDEAVRYAKEFLDIRGKGVSNAVHMLMRLLEYRFGKPRETIEHTGASGGPIEHTIKFGEEKK